MEDPKIRGLEGAIRLKDIALKRAKLEAARNLRELASVRVSKLERELDDARLASQNPDAWEDYKKAIEMLR